ncbi:hypothetical protein BT93_F2684 [Corymbia citriodora subsp. variegata]|nr:hypothetical protein BT93_F2684 [Corymbia citriodora subsp. variegata]
MDAMKQDAIDVFLGNFQPDIDKPAVWELDSDQLPDSGRNGQMDVDEDGRSIFKRCMSDGNILRKTNPSMSTTKIEQEKFCGSVLPDRSEGARRVLSESSPDISTSEREITFSRYTPSMPQRQLFGDVQQENNHIIYSEYGDLSNCSNFVDLDMLSSSGNSCEEESHERSSTLTSSSVAGLSSENVMYGIGATPSTSDSSMKGREHAATELSYHNSHNSDVLEEFSDGFVQWVTYGEALCH